MVNSLFYEIKHSQNAPQLLTELLSSVCFSQRFDAQITDAEILIEQSFYEFGNADVSLLVDNNGKKQCIFIEAKVKTSRNKNWSIQKEFDEFLDVIQDKKKKSYKFTSNLFTQLYYKIRLINSLRNTNDIMQLKEGIKFHRAFTSRDGIIRKIGKNEVVLKAVKKLLPYCNKTFFIALIPENIDEVNIDLNRINPTDIEEWNIGNWGYLSWRHVEEFCERNYLRWTLKNFEWNKGLIY